MGVCTLPVDNQARTGNPVVPRPDFTLYFSLDNFFLLSHLYTSGMPNRGVFFFCMGIHFCFCLWICMTFDKRRKRENSTSVCGLWQHKEFNKHVGNGRSGEKRDHISAVMLQSRVSDGLFSSQESCGKGRSQGNCFSWKTGHSRFLSVWCLHSAHWLWIPFPWISLTSDWPVAGMMWL